MKKKQICLFHSRYVEKKKKKGNIALIDISAKIPWGNVIFISINCDK